MSRPPPRWRRWGLACLAGLGLLTGPSAANSGPDERLLQRAQGEREALVRTLESLVRIETPTEHLPGLAALADLLSRRLGDLGAEVTRVPATHPGRADHLVARLRGDGGRRVLLMAHMDTVYPLGTLAAAPWRLDRDRVWGPGVADAKGGIALILHALALMLEQPSRGFGEVVVLFNSDEERGSLGSKQLIRLLAAEADYVLSFEPSDSPQEALPLSTSGIATVTATVRGRAAHAGTAPESGINALVEAADLVLRTSHLDDLAQGLRFHWTRLQVGSVTNMIPDQAVAQADLRYTNPAELALARQHLEQAAAKRLVPDSMVDIQIDSGRPAFRADPPSRRLAALAVDIYREAGGQLQLSPGTGGGTDIAYASQAGPAVLESLGLPGGGIHSVGREFADLSAVPRRLYLTVRLLGLLAGPPAATRGPDQ